MTMVQKLASVAVFLLTISTFTSSPTQAQRMGGRAMARAPVQMAHAQPMMRGRRASVRRLPDPGPRMPDSFMRRESSKRSAIRGPVGLGETSASPGQHGGTSASVARLRVRDSICSMVATGFRRSL